MLNYLQSLLMLSPKTYFTREELLEALDLIRNDTMLFESGIVDAKQEDYFCK